MNYYEVLEVSVNASKEVIKNAYRALSKKYHPDVYKGNKVYAEEKLKEINTAYEILIDDNKRLLYDYDNGLKIDPNAPIEKEEVGVGENSHNEKEKEQEQDEDKFMTFLKQKKGVCILVTIVAFVFAFGIGILIAESDTSTNAENTVETDSSVATDDDTDENEDNTYYNYNNHTNSNYYENTKPENDKTDTVQEKEDTRVKDEIKEEETTTTDTQIDTSQYGQS